MKLDDSQKLKVAAWIEEGLKLSDIQNRLEQDFGLRMTYLDVRLLVDDLKLKPKDQLPTQPAPTLGKTAAAPSPQAPFAQQPEEPEQPEDQLPAEPPASGVSVSVDQLARPGAMISGKVTFSDGKTAEWFLDQTGRLAVIPPEKGYKPPQTDLQAFQMELQNELQKMGF